MLHYTLLSMIGSVLVFILVLSVLILIHECGHFFAARRMGIWVEEFGFGLPPRLIGKKIGETIYSINLLPFGGFVRLHGENGGEKITRSKEAFLNKSRKARVFVISAGVIMNFVLAIFAFSIVYSFSGIPMDTEKVKVVGVETGSPSYKAGIKEGDWVRQVDGEKVISTTEFIDLVNKKRGGEINLVIEREVSGKEKGINLSLVPRKDYPKDEGPLGVVITSTEIYFPPLWKRPFIGVYYGFKEALFWGKAIVLEFGKLLGNLFVGQIPKDIAGPVGIFALTSEVAKIGVLTLINFVGILSVNLAILNIIPFPALDGGRLLFIGVEALFNKKLAPKIEAGVNLVGMIILVLLFLIITAGDIKRLIVNKGISGFVDSFVK